MIINLTCSQADLIKDLLQEEESGILRNHISYPNNVDTLDDINDILGKIQEAEND